MDTKEAMDFIEQTAVKGSVLGLSRIEELLKLIGNPEKKLKYIHIAGTNGKGSTASMLASILQEAGYKTGLFISPHIHTFNERIQVDGVNIPNECLIKAVEQIKCAVNSMDEKPTEFEIVTAMGFLYFNQCKCDIVVLEVGLGGRLDSTNVVEAKEAAVITNIGLDHTKELGDTVEKIAAEKAGIIKENCDVILYQQQNSVHDIIEAACKNNVARLHDVDFEKIEILKSDLNSQILNYLNFKNIELRLLGEHQLKNAVVVLKTIEVLIKKGWKISDQDIHNGLKKARWPGRFEVLNNDPYFIVDGAHNPNGVESLVNNIEKYFYGRKLIFLTGVLKDKDYKNMLDMIAPFAKKFIAVQPDNPRALDYRDLAMFLRNRYGQAEVIEAEYVKSGIDISLNCAEPDDIVIAFGSLYMVGSIRKYFIK